MQLARTLAAAAFLATTSVASAQVQANPAALSASLAELRHAIGTWDVTTEFLQDDVAIGQSFEGMYAFEWVVEDKIARGVTEIPALKQKSAILFYLRPDESKIEMSSVGPDGKLWVMTGAFGDSVRRTPGVVMPNGATLQLRFTRYNVAPNRFESRMERSLDGGKTWQAGNHQVFRRRKL